MVDMENPPESMDDLGRPTIGNLTHSTGRPGTRPMKTTQMAAKRVQPKATPKMPRQSKAVLGVYHLINGILHLKQKVKIHHQTALRRSMTYASNNVINV